MPFSRPTLAELIQRMITDVESRISAVSAKLKRSLSNAQIRASAVVAHGLHGHIDWTSKQILPDTAEKESLERHADWWGVNRTQAVAAIGSVTFTGTNGSIILAGTVIQRVDTVQYITDADGTISGGTIDVAVTAKQAGQSGNALAGEVMTLVTAIAGVDSSATVASGDLTTGTDTEKDDDLRQRLRNRVQETPQGGANNDYIAWAKEVAGVTRAWVYPQWLGLGTVGLFFVRDDDASLIPDAAEVTEVQTYIDTKRPVTANLTVIAPIEVVQALTIQLNPNTTTIQTAVQTELEDLFAAEAVVEDGTGSGTLLLSHISEAVGVAAGDGDHIVTVPSANLTLSTGELSTLGVITFQAIP